MSQKNVIIVCIVCFALGIGSTYFYCTTSFFNRRVDQPEHRQEHWIELSLPTNSGENLVTYSSDALFNSDIKLPEIRSIKGRAKFVNEATSTSGIKLGYIIDLDIAPLDSAAIPDKYRVAATNRPEVKRPSLDAAYYEVVFYFILKDKDGFPLMKVASNKETVHSGIVNHFQLFANNFIPPAIASNTEAIDVRLEAVKCITCQLDQAAPMPARKKHHGYSLF